jgi:hypothetical protein
MAVCMRCGKALPTPSGILTAYTDRGLLWLAVVIITVSVMAIGLAIGLMTSLFESELPSSWKLALMLAFGAIMVPVIVLSMARALKARRLSHYCSDCAAILTAQKLSSPEEFGAHKVRVKKE